MIRLLYIIAASAILLLTSCESKPTVQKYFIEKSEAKDFVAVDVAPGFIKTDSMDLSADQKKALKSLEHINVLVFKANDSNSKTYDKENAEVKKLLKSDTYEELVKFNHGGMGASISTKGEGEHIEEFVVYMHEPSNGFGLIRVTGDDMTPTNVLTIAQLLQNAPVDGAQLKPLQELFKNIKK